MIIRFSIFLLFYLLSRATAAQDNVGEESTVVYNNDYFAQWSPVTAQDMIDRIPGLTEGGSSRGGFSGRSSGGFGGGEVGYDQTSTTGGQTNPPPMRSANDIDDDIPF